MLFDLRSRGRRRTVRVVYGFLAIIMVVGLVGLGIGTGSTGGILNAGGGGSGGGGGNQLADQQLKHALAAVKKHPTAGNWANLLQARWSAAGSGSNFDSATSTYTAGGKKQLQYGADAWQRFLKLASPQQQTGSTFLQTAFLAAGIYQNLGQWSNEGQAWNLAVQATSGAQRLKPYLCLAYSAYAAKQTTKGNLAAAQAVKLLPKLDRLSQKLALKSASTSPTVAEQG
ncbi:MAG TPA: hypothetical protein VFN36_01365, partial [Solirubrobacteraceae bacterium]|nr:hypothetical protein [Solirubrobacteraceae bacterium]